MRAGALTASSIDPAFGGELL